MLTCDNHLSSVSILILVPAVESKSKVQANETRTISGFVFFLVRSTEVCLHMNCVGDGGKGETSAPDVGLVHAHW